MDSFGTKINIFYRLVTHELFGISCCKSSLPNGKLVCIITRHKSVLLSKSLVY